jgi:hypothetical protein
MLVNRLTKNLLRYKFEYFRLLLNFQDLRGIIENVK